MSTGTAHSADESQQALAPFIPESIPALEQGDKVLFCPEITGVSLGGTVVEGPDAEGYVVVAYAGSQPYCIDSAHNRWVHPGERHTVAWGDRLTGLVLGSLCGPYGNNSPEGRVVRPIPRHGIEEIKPGQPIPGSPKAFTRRNRAGNTLRIQTERGTWAPINVAADGTRFKRHQLTTKICQGARERLDLLAADAQLRVCEVLEALILAPEAAQTVATAKPVGVKVVTPARPFRRSRLTADQPRGQRTRLTKAQGEQLDSILLTLLEQQRTSAADLIEAAAQAAADGLPAQGVNTLRTRLHRLQKRQHHPPQALKADPDKSSAAGSTATTARAPKLKLQ